MLFILFPAFFIISCVDEYWPVLDKYENLLVVDGILTNSDEPVKVRLSLSSAVSSDKPIPLGGGNVYLTDEKQGVTNFSETEPGTYQVIDSMFRGQVGKFYQLHINLPDGRSYESDVCYMKPESIIDSVYGVIEKPADSDDSNDFPGIQFYIENHSEVSDTSYYLWKVTQTYKYRATFDIDYTWTGEFHPFPDPDSLRTCWHTARVSDILVATTGLLDPTTVSQFPLHFVSTETKLLSIRYSPLVQQISISKAAFEFYEAIGEQNIETGNLWSTQPYQILGNIHNISNNSEPVLGFFVVGGATQKRIFVNKPPLTFYYKECVPDFESVQNIKLEDRITWPIYIDDIMVLGWAMADSKACFDCRLEGGSLTPPDFWK